jgi:hypothetical protein
MKVPAECPGELSKEDKKKLKAERQEQAGATPAFDSSVSSPANEASELPALSRKDTMNSLSSGYSARPSRSASNLPTTADTPGVPAELPAAPTTAPPPKLIPAGRRRIAAPPPAQYVSPPPAALDGAEGSKSNEQHGKMLYAYQANGDDEITVDEGRDIVIVEPDGKSPVA